MRLALAGVSHHRAPLELRERVAIDLAAAGALAHELAERDGERHEAVVLSTCNRTELYLAADDETDSPSGPTARCSRSRATAAEALAPVAYRLADESAALHLFRVAAGLDSMVPGEGEILGQVRDAFEAGAPGPLLDRVVPDGAPRRAPRAGRDRDRREPGVDPGRRRGARAAGVRAASTGVASCSSAPAG